MCIACSLGLGGRGNLRQGLLVGLGIATGVVLGARPFAQHVKAEAQGAATLRGLGCALTLRLRQRFFNRAAQHKLSAQQGNRPQGGRHHGVGSQTLNQARRAVAIGQKFFGQGDGTGRQPRQQPVRAARRTARRTTSFCAGKVCAAQLIGRQRDRRLGIGHSQQSFGQTHQSQAFGT